VINAITLRDRQRRSEKRSIMGAGKRQFEAHYVTPEELRSIQVAYLLYVLHVANFIPPSE